MNTHKYQELAMRTNDRQSSIRLLNFELRQNLQLNTAQLLNGCLGLAGEVGEFNDEVKKMIFHEKEPDEKHLQSELGDILWYIALICDTFHWDLDYITRMNIYKLEQRYPEGFDTDKSNNRKENDI